MSLAGTTITAHMTLDRNYGYGSTDGVERRPLERLAPRSIIEPGQTVALVTYREVTRTDHPVLASAYEITSEISRYTVAPGEHWSVPSVEPYGAFWVLV